MKTLLLLLFLTSCISAPELPKAEPLVNLIEPEVAQIEIKGGPEVKPHVEAIRDLYPQIKRVEHKAQEQSSMEKYLPWVISLGGLIWFIWGMRTEDLEDTIGGAIGFVLGITISYFWSVLAWFGLGCLVVFGIIWGVLSYEWKNNKKKDNEK